MHAHIHTTHKMHMDTYTQVHTCIYTCTHTHVHTPDLSRIAKLCPEISSTCTIQSFVSETVDGDFVNCLELLPEYAADNDPLDGESCSEPCYN